MNVFRKLERGLFHLLGPAQVDRAHEDPDQPHAEPKNMVDGGYERRGTPGNYYIVKAEEEPPDPER